MGAGGCVVCHSNHGIKMPSVAMLSGPQAVCTQCHDATSAGGVAAADMAGMLKGLESSLDRSEQILKRARESGMEVSEAQLRLMEGRENLVKARVAVHAFNPAEVKKPVNEGMTIAEDTYRAGQSALKERDGRRIGLAVSLITILVTMLGLWLAIRNLEAKRMKTLAPIILLFLLPAIARSAGIEPLSSAEVCGHCHRAIHEAWKSSSHAQAMESPLFQDALEMATADFGSSGRKTCLGCHSPLIAQTNDAALQKKISWEGITCEYCHSMRDVNTTGPNPVAVLTLAIVKSGPMRETSGSPHGTVFSAVHTSSLVCAPCHEYKNAGGFPVLTTYSEWQASSYAREGKPCQSCHMARVAGDVRRSQDHPHRRSQNQPPPDARQPFVGTVDQRDQSKSLRCSRGRPVESHGRYRQPEGGPLLSDRFASSPTPPRSSHRRLFRRAPGAATHLRPPGCR